MLNNKNVCNILVFLGLVQFSAQANALDCAGKAPGSIQRFNSEYRVCNGATGNFETIQTLSTNTSCSTNNHVEYDSSLNSHKFCDAGTWKGTSCATTTVQTGYCSGVSQMILTDSTGLAEGKFGTAIGLSGDYLVVGAPGSATQTGSISIYKRIANTWQFQTKINGPSNDSLFGISVSINGSSIVVGAPRVAGGGAAYVYTGADATWNLQATLTGAAGDYFGWSVDIYNNRIVVGANNRSSNAGGAYVFSRSGTTWSQTQLLVHPNPNMNDQFGEAVAIYDLTIAVGAHGDDSNAGSVHIFYYNGSSFVQQGSALTGSDTVAGDNFGQDIDLKGDNLVVGAPSNGSAYYFTRSGSTWSERKILTASDSIPDFGSSVAFDDGYILVGAPNRNTNAGAAYLFAGSGAVWPENAIFTASDATAQDLLGTEVAFEGTTAVAGAYANQIGSNFNQGAAYILPLLGLRQKFSGTGSYAGDVFGGGEHSIDIDGDYMIVGAPNDDVAPGTSTTTNEGAAYIFLRNASGVWQHQAKITAATRVAGAQFGNAVSISGITAVVGSAAYSSNQGAVYIFTRSGTTWTQYDAVAGGGADPILGAAGSGFGRDVAIDNDSIIVGSPLESSGVGAARVYNWNGSAHTLESTLSVGGISRAGTSVAIDDDGNVAVVGAPGDGTVSSVAGKAITYIRSNGVWGGAAYLTNPDTGVLQDNYGKDVDIDNGTIAVSRPAGNAGGGVQGVVIFTGSAEGGFTQQAEFVGSTVAANHQFGWNVALSGDELVVSAYGDNSYRGAIYYYKRIGGVWSESAKFIPSDLVANESFGYGVAITNGYVAATNYAGTGILGTVRVYSVNGDPVSACQVTQASKGPTISQRGSSTTLTSSAVTVATGQSLLVCVVTHTTSPVATTGVQWNGVNLNQDASATIASGVRAYIYSAHNLTGGSSAITLNTAAGTNIARTISSMVVGGLATSSTLDQQVGATGSGTSPSSGNTATTTQAEEFIFGCMGTAERIDDPASEGSWQDSLVKNDFLGTTSGSSAGNAVNHSGYKQVTSTGAYRSNKTGTSNVAWASAVATYKTNYANSGTTIACGSYGSCSIPAMINYDNTNGLLWCNGGVWRKFSSAVPTLGSFSISGVSGGGDTTVDATLSDSPIKVDFTTSSNSSSYTVTIKDEFETATICSIAGVTSSPAMPTGCTFAEDVSYTVFITATDGISNKSSSNNGFLFTYNAVGGGSITVVQAKTSTSGGTGTTNLNLTFDSAVTVGNTVIIAIAGRVSTDTVTSVTGLGATWTQRKAVAQSFNNFEIWTATAVSSGTTITINNSATNLRVNAAIEVSGLIGALDVAGGSTAPNSFTIGSPSITTSAASTIVFAFAVIDKTATLSSGPTNGFTVVGPVASSGGASNVTGVAAYKILTSSATESTTWTMSGSGSPSSSSSIISMK